jgi:hypothetical protein
VRSGQDVWAYGFLTTPMAELPLRNTTDLEPGHGERTSAKHMRLWSVFPDVIPLLIANLPPLSQLKSEMQNHLWPQEPSLRWRVFS